MAFTGHLLHVGSVLSMWFALQLLIIHNPQGRYHHLHFPAKPKARVVKPFIQSGATERVAELSFKLVRLWDTSPPLPAHMTHNEY